MRSSQIFERNYEKNMRMTSIDKLIMRLLCTDILITFLNFVPFEHLTDLYYAIANMSYDYRWWWKVSFQKKSACLVLLGFRLKEKILINKLPFALSIALQAIQAGNKHLHLSAFFYFRVCNIVLTIITLM